MLFTKGAKIYDYEVRRESGENVAYVNYLGAPFLPSIARFPEVMSQVIDLLIASANVSRVVLVQQRNYNYNSQKVQMLREIAELYTFLVKKENVLSPAKLSSDMVLVPGRHNFMA